MAKKLSTILLILTIIFTSVLVCPSANASTKSVSDLRDELSDLLKDKEDAEKKLATIEEEVNDIQDEINEINSEIAILNEEISELKSRIKLKKAEIEEQEGNLDERLIAMYKQGSVGFVDVLLGSHSISEFVSNVKLLKIIHKYDQKVVQLLQEEYEQLKVVKAELDTKNSELSKKKTTLKNKKSELAEKIESISDQIETYEFGIKDVSAEILALTDSSSEYVGGDFVFPLDSKYRVASRVGSRWGMRLHPIYKIWKMHGGTDFKVPGGSKIYACATGKVIKATEYGGYGLCVMIDHGGGIVSMYAHCSKLLCSKGDVVVAGENIALVGKTGSATGNHLHFEVRVNGKTVDSLKYFPDLYEILGP